MRGAAPASPGKLGLAVALLAVPGIALAAPLPADRYETLIIGSDQSAWERGPADAPVLVELYFAPGHAGAAAAAEVVRRGIPRSDGRRDGVAVREALRLVPLRTPDGPDLVSEALVVVLTIFRRRAQVVDRTLAPAAVTAVSLVGQPLSRAGGAEPLLPDMVTASLSADVGQSV